MVTKILHLKPLWNTIAEERLELQRRNKTLIVSVLDLFVIRVSIDLYSEI
jgi:hypothetical protein